MPSKKNKSSKEYTKEELDNIMLTLLGLNPEVEKHIEEYNRQQRAEMYLREEVESDPSYEEIKYKGLEGPFLFAPNDEGCSELHNLLESPYERYCKNYPLLWRFQYLGSNTTK